MVGKNGVYHIITEAMAPLHDYLRLWWWNCELPDRRQCKTWWTLVICTLKKTGSGLLGYKRCWKQTFYCLITFRFPVSLYLRVALQSNAERCWGLSCLKTVWTCLDLGIATDLGVHLSSVLHHFHHIDAPCRYWRLDSGIGFTLLEWHKVTPPCFGWPVFSSSTIRFGQARPDCCGRWGWGHALHFPAVHACFRAGLRDQTWPGRSTFLLDLTRTNRRLDWGDDGRCMFDARFFLIQYYIYNIIIYNIVSIMYIVLYIALEGWPSICMCADLGMVCYWFCLDLFGEQIGQALVNTIKYHKYPCKTV